MDLAERLEIFDAHKKSVNEKNIAEPQQVATTKKIKAGQVTNPWLVYRRVKVEGSFLPGTFSRNPNLKMEKDRPVFHNVLPDGKSGWKPGKGEFSLDPNRELEEVGFLFRKLDAEKLAADAPAVHAAIERLEEAKQIGPDLLQKQITI